MKKYQKIIITALLWSLITIIFSAGIAIAQDSSDMTYKMQVGLPGTEFAESITMTQGSTYYIALFVQALYRYGISIVAILAAIMIMAGGLIWLTSGGSQEKISKAKDIIVGSLTGIVLLFSSWIILNTINPALVNFDIQDVEVVKRQEVCCHPVHGLVIQVPAHGSDDLICPQGSPICKSNERCQPNPKDVIGDRTIPWSCLDTSQHNCCEYSDGISIYCKTISGNQVCNPNQFGGANLRNTYNNTMCDSDAEHSPRSALLGGKCHYGGEKACCQCRSMGAFGVYLSRNCRDYYSQGECDYWCHGILHYESKLMSGKCQENGRCK